jgi:hypothetical protein
LRKAFALFRKQKLYSASASASALVAVLQAELGAVAARLALPEYMLTSDAENANWVSGK